jgi:hypothetical protein
MEFREKGGKAMRRICRRGGLLLVLLACLFSQSSCGSLEIEERAFPLALWIEPCGQEGLYEFSFFFEEDTGEGEYVGEHMSLKADNYKSAYELFAQKEPYELDDTHMQAILLGEKIMKDDGFLCDFLETFQTEQHFAWNTVLYLASDALETAKLVEATDGRPGSYLKDMAEHDSKAGRTSHTIGDLFVEWNNREGNLQLAVLGADAPSVEKYIDICW